MSSAQRAPVVACAVTYATYVIDTLLLISLIVHTRRKITYYSECGGSRTFAGMMALAHSLQSQLVNPELVKERKRSSFQAIELTNILDGGPRGTERRREVEQLCIDNPKFKSYKEFISLSFDDYYSKSTETRASVPQIFQDIVPEVLTIGRLDNFFSPHVASIVSPAGDPFTIHGFMFVPTILSQATEEQKARWIPLIRNNTMIGTFCMTELGHGTNIRRLETTATYDPKTEEFVIHSPTSTSIKCWSGGMGRTSNSAVVFAQLYSKGQCHGLHMFFVQLRSYEDHRPLPGIKVGDMGPKMGLNSFDNGFAKFEHVRIPRTNMLMKNAKLLPDGTYIKPAEIYADSRPLLLARSVVIINSIFRLAQATTIAVRYNAVRRQGQLEPGDVLEVKILDYRTQQHKLFPCVAMAYAGLTAFKAVFRLYEDLAENYSDKKAGEVHALLAGMKSISTGMGYFGINQCLQACGANGYLEASFLPFLSTCIGGFCITDGENTILMLQTARYLIKAYRTVREGKSPFSPCLAYLNAYSDLSRDAICTSVWQEEDVLKLFQRTTARLIAEITNCMEEAIANGASLGQAWNNNTPDLLKCSQFHMMTFIIDAARSSLAENMSQALRVVLQRLFDLLALHWMRENTGDFMQFGGVSAENLKRFDSRLSELHDEIRPEIVTLVDAFDFRDESLQSVIGCYDGRVYERLFEYLTNLPSNKTEVHPVFEKYLKPMRQFKPKL